MLYFFTIVIIGITAWAQYRNGFFSSCIMLFNVIVSGLIAFGFWEPLADTFEPRFQNSALAGCEDFLALVLLFSASLCVLRSLSHYLAPELIEVHGALQFLGAGALGMLTGYLVASILLCAMQTLPLDVNFMGFEQRDAAETPYRSIFPGDRVWLSLVRSAGMGTLSWKEDPAADVTESRYLVFDRAGTFELRYARYRRSTDTRPAMQYLGEFDRELGKQKPR